MESTRFPRNAWIRRIVKTAEAEIMPLMDPVAWASQASKRRRIVIGPEHVYYRAEDGGVDFGEVLRRAMVARGIN